MIKVKQYEISNEINTQDILEIDAKYESHLILASPMSDIGRAFSEVVDICYELGDWKSAYKVIVNRFLMITNDLFEEGHVIYDDLNDLFVEMEWQLEEEPSVDKLYFLDQAQTVGPIISSKILYYLLREQSDNVFYIDTRDIVITDNNYGDGNILPDPTTRNIENLLAKKQQFIVMADRIGSSTENYGVMLSENKLKKIFITHSSHMP